MAKTIWTDEYTGPRWTYGLTYRPLATAHVPEGWIIDLGRAVPAQGFAFGIVEYPRELTEREVANYELTPVVKG